MGLCHADIEISNVRNGDLSPLVVKSFVDTGAVHLRVPEQLAVRLGLDLQGDKREVTSTSGERKLCPYVGPLQVAFGDRKCFVGAVVLGDEVVLGAIPMDDMDLIVHPARQEVVANPDAPNTPASTAK